MSIRTSTWVSKTDLTRYLRCPYAFHLLHRGLVTFAETVTEQQVRLIREGIDFHVAIEAKAVPTAIDPAELPKVFAEKSIRMFGVPIFGNPELQIYGQPDAIDTAQGALFPVEVKSHKDVQRSDELELAFYWMLLEPLRTRTASPRGFLLLRRNGVEEPVEINIRPQRFEQVRGLLKEIRDARDHGVRPRICACTVCSGVMRDEIRRIKNANKDLTMIWDIGLSRARHLEGIGISTYDELLALESATIVAKLRERKCYISPAQAERWKHHATSYSTSSPVVFGDPPPLDGSYLALDLEYEPGRLIWLVGICVVTPRGREYLGLWADTPAEETINLMRLAEIVATNPFLPVVTWSGTGADMPQLRCSAQRLKLGPILDIVIGRHFDLFQHTIKSVRFPIPQLGLGELATYFALPQMSSVRNGLEALLLYQEYRHSQDEDKRVAIKTNLHDYNRDDLEALVGVTDRIASLRRGSQAVTAIESR